MFDKYKRIEQFNKNEIDKATNKAKNDKYYPSYHIAPKNGLVNDPNGLIFKDGVHYIHYQIHPVNPIHGLKYWELVTTKDFINYEYLGLSNSPELKSESHGVFSGSAYLEDNQIKIIYTGNHRNNKKIRKQTQILATLNNKNKVVDKENIIEHDSKLFDEHIRDPKVIEIHNKKYIYFGVKQNSDKTGAIAFYDFETKKHCFNLKLNVKNFGYMWECPNIQKIGNKYLIIFCPQGAESNDKIIFSNSYSVVYCLASDINTKTGELIDETYPELMDYGTDFYAPQLYLVDDKVVSIGWFGTLDVVYPSDKNCWQGMLTIPKELSFEGNHLIQKPYSVFSNQVLSAKKIIKGKEIKISKTSMISFELTGNEKINIGNDTYFLQLKFNDSQIIVDRKNCQEKIETNFGDVRKTCRLEDKQLVEIWLDNSSAEIMVNNYKSSFTTRFFIEDVEKIISENEHEFTVYDVKNSIFKNKYNSSGL